MPDEADQAETSNKVVIQPARPWPVYNVDRAKAELIAMELLTQGVSQYRVRFQTKLSAKEVRRLAAVVAEDAQNPPVPRIVGRSPQPNRTTPAVPPARAPRTAVIRPARHGHHHTRPAARPETPAEPEQMAFALD